MAKKSSGGTKSSGSSRSAVSGRYVTGGYAKSHPKTTVTESLCFPKILSGPGSDMSLEEGRNLQA